jgi:hypothetical protein
VRRGAQAPASDANCPSGKTNATASGQANSSGHVESLTRAATSPPGSGTPFVLNATSAYGCSANATATDSAPSSKIQPIGCPGSRHSSSRPTALGASTADARKG